MCVCVGGGGGLHYKDWRGGGVNAGIGSFSNAEEVAKGFQGVGVWLGVRGPTRFGHDFPN